jgi:hypothetical protein
MSADAAFEYLYTAREIAGDLSEAVRNMRTWNRENGAERHITYLTAIETVATRMSKVAEILDEIGEQGTGRNTRDDASAAVERLQDAIRELTRSSDP